MVAARSGHVGNQGDDEHAARRQVVDRGADALVIERHHGDAVDPAHQRLQRFAEHRRVEYVGENRLHRGAPRSEPPRKLVDLVADHLHEDVVAGRRDQREADRLGAREFRGGPQRAKIVARHRLAHATRRIGTHPAASVQDPVDRRDADPRFARNIFQRARACGRFRAHSIKLIEQR
jgi:hypothetical protein